MLPPDSVRLSDTIIPLYMINVSFLPIKILWQLQTLITHWPLNPIWKVACKNKWKYKYCRLFSVECRFPTFVSVPSAFPRATPGSKTRAVASHKNTTQLYDEIILNFYGESELRVCNEILILSQSSNRRGHVAWNTSIQLISEVACANMLSSRKRKFE